MHSTPVERMSAWELSAALERIAELSFHILSAIGAGIVRCEHVDFGKLEAERVSVRAEIDRRAALVEVKA